MSFFPPHIPDDELIDFTLDALADERIPEVLEHLAACDECAARSTQISQTAAVWDNWKKELARDQGSESFWRARIAQAVASLRLQPEKYGGPVAEVLERLRQTPATITGAALEIVLDAADESARILAHTAEALGLGPQQLDVSYSEPGTARGGEQHAGRYRAAFLVTPFWPDGVNVQVDAIGRRIGLTFDAEADPPLVLLIPGSGASPILLSEHAPTGRNTASLEIPNVPLERSLLLILHRRA